MYVSHLCFGSEDIFFQIFLKHFLKNKKDLPSFSIGVYPQIGIPTDTWYTDPDSCHTHYMVILKQLPLKPLKLSLMM